MVIAAKRCREHKTAMSDLVSQAWEALRGLKMGDQLQRIPENLKGNGPGSCPESWKTIAGSVRGASKPVPEVIRHQKNMTSTVRNLKEKSPATVQNHSKTQGKRL